MDSLPTLWWSRSITSLVDQSFFFLRHPLPRHFLTRVVLPFLSGGSWTGTRTSGGLTTRGGGGRGAATNTLSGTPDVTTQGKESVCPSVVVLYCPTPISLPLTNRDCERWTTVPDRRTRGSGVEVAPHEGVGQKVWNPTNVEGLQCRDGS